MRTPRARFVRPQLEILEDRVMPSVDPLGGPTPLAKPGAEVGILDANSPQASPSSSTIFNPAQISQAYSFNQITFKNGTIKGDGSGQTIAIVDAYNQPNLVSDLSVFDKTYGLPTANLTVVNENGGTALPAADQGWGVEISLDVEWAHAMAPEAKILLVEANTNGYADLMSAVDYARNQPNVSVVSMSWGSGEFSDEAFYDSHFTTPAGHIGITFVASSGDTGSAGAPEYPSVSPNVLAVGGTQLILNADGSYSEVAWSGSGGGISSLESQPSYQRGVVTQTSTRRAVPDVSYNGSGNSYFSVYDSFGYNGWVGVYGTSAGAPQWASLIAIANQGRALAGEGTLNGTTQTLPMIYQLPQSDFHDITSGSNGAYSAGPGYDLVTGRGSPIANRIVAGLISPGGNSSTPPWVVSSASASANPVTGTSTNLSVRGNDNSGAANLTYTWSLLSEPSGIAAPTASVNGNNAAQNTTVTFYGAGTYVFQVLLTDPASLTASSTVTVTVNQTLTGLALTPGSSSLYNGAALQFTVTATDQFGHAMSAQPNWSLSGAGSLAGSGLYTAPSAGAGTAIIQVSIDGLMQTATVAFAAPPTSLPGLPIFSNPSDPWSAWLQLFNAWLTQLQSVWEALLASRQSG